MTDNGNIDLLGMHYLHQMNSFIYLGGGLHAPLFYGNYGGFMTFDFTLHFQQKLANHWFLNGGVSFGGGGGGSSIDQSIELTGQGQFIKQYVGVGYDTDYVSFGLNYCYFEFYNSLINHSQFNVFVQKPISFSTGLFDYAGETISSDHIRTNQLHKKQSKQSVGVEFNTMDQIDPEGIFTDDINAISVQFSHYPVNDYYVFFQADIGYHGIPAYNQALLGGGYRYLLSSRLNFRTQLAIGSGGYSPTEVDTASGILLYPKLSLEYLLNPKLGVSFNNGYLMAPRGTAKMISFGIGFNYHPYGVSNYEDVSDSSFSYRGYHFMIGHQRNYDVMYKDLSGNESEISDLDILNVKMDYFFNDHLFLPFQLNMAVNDILDYPGYGEVLSGIGLKSDVHYRFQCFSQVLVGANPFGLIFKPELGFHYYLTDDLSLSAQVGQLIALDSVLDTSENLFTTKTLNASTVGMGMTYHFSLLESAGLDK